MPDKNGDRHAIFGGVEGTGSRFTTTEEDRPAEYQLPNGKTLVLREVSISREDLTGIANMKGKLNATLESWQKLVGWKDVPDKKVVVAEEREEF